MSATSLSVKADAFRNGQPSGTSNVIRDTNGFLISWIENGFSCTVVRDSTSNLPLKLSAVGQSIRYQQFYTYDGNGLFLSANGDLIPSVLLTDLLGQSIAGGGAAATAAAVAAQAAAATASSQATSANTAATNAAASAAIKVGYFNQNTLPSSGTGATGDTAILTLAPLSGIPIQKGASNWSTIPNTYSWAGKPAAGSYPGASIWISDFGNRWISISYDAGSTYKWVPENFVFDFVSKASEGSVATGTGATVIHNTDSLPSNVVFGGCRIELEFANLYSNNGAGTPQVLVGSTGSAGTMVPIGFGRATTAQLVSESNWMYVSDQTTSWHTANSTGASNQQVSGSNSRTLDSAGTTQYIDWSQQVVFKWQTASLAAGVTAQPLSRRIGIRFPSIAGV